MDVSGTDVRLWVNERQSNNGSKWKDYSVGISKKNQEDDSWDTAYMRVRFTKDVKVPEDLENGQKIDFDGFLSVDKYTDRNGNEVKKPMIVITGADFGTNPIAKAEPVDYGDKFEEVEESIPF